MFDWVLNTSLTVIYRGIVQSFGIPCILRLSQLLLQGLLVATLTCLAVMKQCLILQRIFCHIKSVKERIKSNFKVVILQILSIPANIYLFKVDNRNTRKTCEICSKLTLFLLFTVNIFHTFFKCFYCWLRTSKFQLRCSRKKLVQRPKKNYKRVKHYFKLVQI